MLLSPLLIALSAPALLPAPAAQSSEAQPPPGMVLIRGTRATIGTPAKEVLQIGEENHLNFRALVYETPQFEERVDDFFLMVTEVTNEQYEAFVKATDHAPPQSWGRIAIEEAQRRTLEEQGRLKQEARKAGADVPQFPKFDPAQWWEDNWQTADWAVPGEHETRPVVFVDYQDATAYARWAGLRLMSEFEFQLAGRGRGKGRYPWGDEWVPSALASQEMRLNDAMRVASFPKGATEDGLYDLCGNVWEWSSSPFRPYPKFEILKLKIKENNRERVIEGLADWDANQRVLVGGSIQNGELACRLTTRRPADRSQKTNSLGFRCAASTTPGIDMAHTILSQDLPTSKRPEGVAYVPEQAVATDRWQSLPGTAKTKAEDGSSTAVPHYAVITSYDYLLFMPVQEIDAVQIKDLDEKSVEEGPVHFGVFAQTRPSLVPELAAGTYMVAYRGPGEPRKARAAAAPSEEIRQQEGQGEEPVEVVRPAPELPADLDREVANLIFYGTDMKPVTFLPLTGLEAKRPQPPRVAVGASTRDVMGTDEEGNPIVVKEPVTEARFELSVLGKVSNRGYVFQLPIQYPVDGPVTKDWRN